MRRLLDGLYLAAGGLAAAFLVAIFVLMIALSGGREIGINVHSGDDFVAWCLVSMSFLGLAHTFKRGEMIRVGLLLERLEGRTRWLFELVALTVTAVFVCYFTRYAVQLVIDSWRLNDMSTGTIIVPLWIPQLGFAIGLAILAIAVLDELVRVAGGHRPTYEKDKPLTPEEIVARAAEGGGV